MRPAMPAVALALLGSMAACTGQAPTPSQPSTTQTPGATISAAASPTSTPSAAFSIPGSIWFGPLPPLPPSSTLPFNDGSVDYFDLWQPGASWPQAASKVGLFKIYSSWVMDYATTEQLQQVVAGVAGRGMALALETGAFSAGDVGCGFGVEGFDAGLEPLQRIQAVGGHVDVIAFDEPYSFGVRDPSPNACHWTVDRAASEALHFVSQLRDFDPHLLIGDTEPMWQGITATDIGAWLDAYAATTGRPMDFLQLDADWALADWAQTFRAVEEAARARGIPVAPIYNGGDVDSDAEWADLAMARAYDYETVVGGRPDFVVLQSWNAHPDNVLPETDPTTFTGLINRYLAPRTVIELAGAEPAGSGRLDVGVQLSTVEGDPVQSAAVRASLTPLDPVRQVLSVDGVVPEGATIAAAAIRVNAEGVGPGPADLHIYGLNYSEGDNGGNLIPNARFAKGLTGWGVEGTGTLTTPRSDEDNGSMLRLRATPEQSILINSTGFAVSAGASYHFEVTVKVPPDSAASAYAATIFLNGPTELRRDLLALAPAPIDAGSEQTDAQGGALFHLEGAAGQYRFRADYSGDLNHWPAWIEQPVTMP